MIFDKTIVIAAMSINEAWAKDSKRISVPFI